MIFPHQSKEKREQNLAGTNMERIGTYSSLIVSNQSKEGRERTEPESKGTGALERIGNV